MKNILKYIVIFATLLTLASLFYFKVYIPKTTYKTTSSQYGDMKVLVHGIGNINAQDIYSITAQSGGKIIDILVKEGSWVKKNDLLVKMDGIDLPKQMGMAQSSLHKAKFDFTASLDELKNQEVQKALLQKTYNRYAKLNKQGYVSQAEYDKALADLNSINSTILVSQSHINAAKAQIQLSKNSMQAIKIKLDNLNVYAPVDGYVISKDAQIVQSVLPTTPILKIVDVKTLWVETKIDERTSANVKVGQTASIVLSSQPKKIYKGFVKQILPVSDMVTLERVVDIAFVNIPKPFYINGQAEVSIETKLLQNALQVPLNVVVQNGGKLGVWTLQNAHAHFQEIQRVTQNDTFIAIKSLKKDTKIIVPNPDKKPLKEGMRVHL